MNLAEIRQFNLRTLRYFLVLAEELHFGRAARRLNMSQPPLSQQIRQLEEALQVELFRRSHHSVELTIAGRAFLERVPLVFEQLDKAVSHARMTARGQVGRLEIGVISSSLVGVIPTALETFRHRYPEVEWQLHELTPSAQIEALVERRIDICLFRMPPEHEGLHREPIMQEEVMIALPRAHPLAQDGTQDGALALDALRDQPFVMFGLRQSRFADYLHQCCLQAGFTPQIRQQVVEVQSLLSLVGANMGVALLPDSMRELAPPGVVFRSIAPVAPQVPLYAIHRRGDPSPTLRHFLEIIREKVAERTAEGGTTRR
ncbi:LysR substrate-binding domain-containing protein [Paracoccus binzhouensis]|uniref:LysR substrate-binding domain-containing protein n=1 Tax=Paracoccus binzhouensis TaxID=2796149 RepID=UPI0018EF1803|nr:LysR substrate-binding domain-containing protein [Paracoccus binzhouensis]